MLDPSQLSHVCATRSSAEAEETICRVMEDLAMLLGRVMETATEGPPEVLHASLSALSDAAHQIGLRGLGRVASDVMICIEDHDPIARSATLARLARIGEVSLSQLWDLQDLSV